jgi:hypothetical protein
MRIWKQPPPSPLERNYAQNEHKIGGASINGGDITSTGQQVSPPKATLIYAQKTRKWR